VCGIAGIVFLDGHPDVESELVVRMTRAMIHRGPDDEGFFRRGPVGFGARRLSIVDVAGGHQPLSNEDGHVWIALNGEIYNHPELRRSLQALGHRYRTNCDTETVVHCYEEHGVEGIDKLRGMFAFSIWDARRRTLVICRDRLGIKPLYWCVYNGALIFASEVKAILAAGVPFEIEEKVLECYLRLGYVPGRSTLFKGIMKLPPAHYLVAELGRREVQTFRYWTPRFTAENDLDEPECLEVFGRLLERTVADHRLGERPQGVFLSGGVDSSSLVAIHAAQLKDPVLTFSVGYTEERETSEFPQARRVAQQYGTRHHEYELSGHDFRDSLPRLVWHMDEPVADPAAIPLFFLSQLAREHITVIHSGEGADEILAGYAIYGRMLKMSEFQKRFGLLAARLVSRGLRLQAVPLRFRRYSEMFNEPLERRYQGVRRVLTSDCLRHLSRNGFPSAEHQAYREELISDLYRQTGHCPELNKMLSLDQQTWLPDDLLVKADKMTMAASIELRVPFLDHQVVELAGRLPISMKLRGSVNKYLLKRLMRDRLPSSILNARKRGFPVPMTQWLRGDLYESAQSWLLDSPLLKRFLARDGLEALLKDHRNGRADLKDEIYGLIVLSIWEQVFSGSPTADKLHHFPQPTVQNPV
jgi:asparagine synthase (glutamine-hydrolysing)